MIPYAWTTDDDEIAMDAITVGIGDDAPALIAAGMTPSEPLANVYWPDWVSQGDKINASMEGPYPVVEVDVIARFGTVRPFEIGMALGEPSRMDVEFAVRTSTFDLGQNVVFRNQENRRTGLCMRNVCERHCRQPHSNRRVVEPDRNPYHVLSVEKSRLWGTTSRLFAALRSRSTGSSG